MWDQHMCRINRVHTAQQPAPAPHLARVEGRAALRFAMCGHGLSFLLGGHGPRGHFWWLSHQVSVTFSGRTPPHVHGVLFVVGPYG